MGALLGIIVVGLVYALFTFGINKGAETFNDWNNARRSKELPLGEGEKVAVESFEKEGYTFYFKNKYGTYLKDTEGHLYTLEMSQGKWVLKRFKS